MRWNPLGRNVQEESPDELVCREGHSLLLIVVAVISPDEFHFATFDIDDPIVGDGHAVGVAANVIHHLLWSGEGRFRVDDPVQVAHRLQMTLLRNAVVYLGAIEAQGSVVVEEQAVEA